MRIALIALVMSAAPLPRLLEVRELTAYVDDDGCHVFQTDGGTKTDNGDMCQALKRSIKIK